MACSSLYQVRQVQPVEVEAGGPSGREEAKREKKKKHKKHKVQCLAMHRQSPTMRAGSCNAAAVPLELQLKAARSHLIRNESMQLHVPRT